MTDPTREAFDLDQLALDAMCDCWRIANNDGELPIAQVRAYMQVRIREAIQAALSARVQGEAVAYMVRAASGGVLCYPVSRERGVPEPRDGETVTPLYAATAVRAVDVDGLICALDEISGKCRALRSGGPDPVDLHGLSDALSEAVEIANEQLHNLLALTQPEAE